MPFLKVLENQYKPFSEKDFLKERNEELPEEPNLKTSATLSFDFVTDFGVVKPKSNYNKKKGDSFEDYVGSLYEQKNFIVRYYGHEKNSKDLGRDLICKFGNYTVIVQCKCYKDSTDIKVQDIYYFFGSVKHYAAQNAREIVSASFWTTQNMLDNSPKAFSAALELGIRVYFCVPFTEKS